MISFGTWNRKRIGPVVFERVLTWKATVAGAFLIAAWITSGTVYVIVADMPDTWTYAFPWSLAMAYPTLKYWWRIETVREWSPFCRPRWKPQPRTRRVLGFLPT